MQRYISNELSHFVGKKLSESEQYSLLVEIIKTGRLTHPPHTPNMEGNLIVRLNADFSSNEMYNPGVVCFCDIPVQDLLFHSTKYSRFGISFSKDILIKKGAAPVFYLPNDSRVNISRAYVPKNGVWPSTHEEPNETIGLGSYFDRMVKEFRSLIQEYYNASLKDPPNPGIPLDASRILELERFLNFQIFSFIKFFEHSLPENDPNNFYYEREWRIIGNVEFTVHDVSRILIPSSYAKSLREDLPDYYGQITFV
jgi:hypothetical protein